MNKLLFLSLFALVFIAFFTVNTYADFYVVSANNKCGPCKGTRSAEGRWCDNEDGTVTDMRTCLVWLKYADWGGSIIWRDCTEEPPPDDAHIRSGILKSGETIRSSGGETVSASTMQLFDGIQAAVYWTSTTLPSNTNNAYYVDMTDGAVSNSPKTLNRRVWPVRDAK